MAFLLYHTPPPSQGFENDLAGDLPDYIHIISYVLLIAKGVLEVFMFFAFFCA